MEFVGFKSIDGLEFRFLRSNLESSSPGVVLKFEGGGFFFFFFYDLTFHIRK